MQRDRRAVGRTKAAQVLEIVAADGSRLHDARGRTFIDFQTGWSVGNLGWNPPQIVARVKAFAGPSYVTPDMVYEPWVELAERLLAVAPGRLARVYRAVTGTEAVELALQLAMTKTGRHEVISIEDAYHGNSVAARSLGSGGIPARVPAFGHLAPPLDARALDRLETRLKHRDVAAFIMEPIVTNLNVLIPDDEFMRGLVPLCHRYGTLVIADEVACGLGRTGRFFACEHYDLEPDLVTLAKALGGGVAPIAATLATAEVANAARDELSFYSTFGWQPIAVEAALATLDYWDAHGDVTLANVAARSQQLEAGIRATFGDTEIRSRGLAIGVGLDDEDYVEALGKRCREDGLLLYASEDSIVLMPPLTVDEATCAEALEIIAGAA